MAEASYVQTSFLGGEWSPYYQGRMDNPRYRMAMNRCLNAIPLEEGACTRRPGTRFAATTRDGNPGRLMAFNFRQAAPYNLEFTDNHMRIFSGPILVKEDPFGVTDISPASPSVVTVAGEPDWSTGDVVQFLFATASTSVSAVELRFRQLRITMTGDSTFTMEDPITGDPVDGVIWDPLDITTVARIVDFSTPYTDWENLRLVQDEETALLLHRDSVPYVFRADTSPSSNSFANFTFGPSRFLDGPYLDPPTGAIATPDATTGIITVALSYQAWSSSVTYAMDEFVANGGFTYKSLVNANLNHIPASSPTYWEQVSNGAAAGDDGFTSGDIGRLIRLFSEPLEWDSGTTYSPGDKVTFQDSYYTALTPDPDNDPDPNLNKQPDLALAYWAYDPSAAGWTWGEILSINSVSSVEVQLMADLLYSNPIHTWRLGVYSNKTGWPTCGAYHEGRFWLAGAQGNRVDSSKSNDPFNFSPTAPDGSVADDNAISAIFNADKVNTILWLMPDYLGVVCGTQEGEWILQASSLNDPLTPTSLQAHKVTTYGSEFINPIKAPLATVFVQRYARKVMELMSDKYSSGSNFSGNNLSLESKHLTASTVLELAYQEELTPIVWARNGDGTLIGCTYRRVTTQANAVPALSAWHRHELGSERTVESICTGPSVGGDLDSLTLVTKDADDIYHVEFLTNIFDEDSTLLQAWFLDNAVTPSGATADDDGVTFYGLWYLNGKDVTVFVGGLDLGVFTVANGQITVPFTTDFTLEYLREVSASGEDFGGLAVYIDETVTTPPPVEINDEILYYPTTPDASGGTMFTQWDGTAVVITGSIYKFDIETGTQTGYLSSTTIVGEDTQVTRQGTIAYDGYYYCGDPGGRVPRFDLGTMEIKDIMGFVASGMIPGVVWNTEALYAQGNYIIMSGGNADETMTVIYADEGGMTPATVILPYSGDIIRWCRPEHNPEATFATAYGIGSEGMNVADVSFYIVGIDARASEELDKYPLWNSSAAYITGQKVSYQWSGTNHSIGYIALADNTNTQPNVNSSGTWARIPNPYITFEERATIAATAIDPTWSTILYTQGHVYDNTDGNLIAIFATDDAVATQSYIVKYSSLDGSVIWTTATPSGFTLGYSRCRRGVIGALDSSVNSGPTTLYRLDTSDGSITTKTLNGVYAIGNQTIAINSVFDDTLGALIQNMDFAAGSGTPTPIPPTPNLFLQRYGRLYEGSFLIGDEIVDQRTTFPAVIGFPYVTQCQILRPFSSQDSGTRNGPAFGKTRREERFGALVHKCVVNSIEFGTTFNRMYPALFTQPDVTIPYTPLELYSDIFSATLEDDYTYNSMLCWQITGPYPGTVLTIGGFITSYDR